MEASHEFWFDHENREVYREAIALIAWLSELLETLGRVGDVRDQLDRASTSTALNIAEGNGKFSPKDLMFRRSSQRFPRIFQRGGERLREPVGPRVQAHQPNDRTLRLGQLGHHHLGVPLTDPNLVPLDRREHLD